MRQSLVLIFTIILLLTQSGICKECNTNSDIECAYLKAWGYIGNNNDSAWRYCNLSFSLIDKHTSVNHLAKAYTVRGIILQSEHRYDEAFNALRKALDFKLLLGDSLEISKGYGNIGNTLLMGERYQLAKDYFVSCLQYSNPSNDSVSYVANCSNLGLLYSETGQMDSAFIIFDIGQAYIKKTHLNQASSDLYFNLSKLYRSERQFQLAIDYLFKAIRIQVRTQDNLGLGMSHLNLGICYQLMEEYDRAFINYSIADSINYSLKNLQLEADIKKGQFLLPFYTNSDRSHLIRFRNWFDVEDELSQQKINSNVAETEAKYQTKLKDEELKVLQERSEKAEAISERNFWLAITGGCLTFLLVGIAFFINIYRKQKQLVLEERMQKNESDFNEAIAEQELAVITKSKDAGNKEKSRISAELHDNISSRLTAMNIVLQSNKPIDKEQLKVHLKESMRELRTVAHDLANEAENGNTFKANLLALKGLLNGSEITFKPFLEGLPNDLESELEKHLFRIVMELMNNSLKHAKCTELVLECMKVKNELIVLLEDNGIGFNPAKQKKGFGLNSIEKRVITLGANLSIDSKPNRGTTIVLKIPLL